MIAFITSLRNPLNSDSYDRVEKLLRETLASVCAQSDENFVVVVVGNRAPTSALPDKVHFVPVDFPPTSAVAGPRTELGPFVWDKGTKIGAGLAFARQFRPDHVMIFDADDFVSNRIASYANARPNADGWVITDGWMYSGTRRVFRKVGDFNRVCGTCYVIPFAAYGVPEGLEAGATQTDIAEAFGDRLFRILGAHREAVAWHREHGRRLKPLPFRGAVYHVDTGENHSGISMQGIGRPPTSSLRREFGVPDQSSLLASLWRSINVGGPRVIVGKVVARVLRLVRSRLRRSPQ